MNKKYLVAFLSIILFAWGAFAADKANWGDDVYIDADGVIYAGSGISMGAETKNILGFYRVSHDRPRRLHDYY